MYLLIPPSSARIQAFLAQQSCLPFSYSPVGTTHLQVCQVPAYLPPGYVIDHNRTLLGHGEAVFVKARAALRAWRMFALDWVDPFLYPAVLAENTAVAILARLPLPLPLPGLWSLNAARIIYILQQSGPVGGLISVFYQPLSALCTFILWHRWPRSTPPTGTRWYTTGTRFCGTNS